MAHVKWLCDITVLDRAFDGFQNTVSYRMKTDPDDPGTPVTRMEPRALLIPPGMPDFMSRVRIVRPGPVPLRGRAWSGWGTIRRVEVSTDDGATWDDAELGEQPSRWAWRAFSATWDAQPGEHRLRVRAHDSDGRVQGSEPRWNRGGFTNNADQPLTVHVIE
jgi:hypothetical protein